MQRLQFNEKLRVGQYKISEPPTVFYTEYYSSLKGMSTVDWQQQMRTFPTQFHTSDHRADGLDSTSDYIRPLLTTVLTPTGTFNSTISMIYTSIAIAPNQTHT